MSEATQTAQRQRKLTTGHHTLDWWAAGVPLALAVFALDSVRRFDPYSGVGIFQWVLCAALVALAVVILVFRVHVPNHRDYYGGLALIGLALLGLWAGSDLPGLRNFTFGAGTAPRLFACALAFTAAVITVIGLVTEGPPVGKYAVRGPLFVCLGVLCFALLIRGVVFEVGGTVIKIPAFGLIAASFVTFMVSAIASRETRWWETTIMAASITAFCWLVFVKLLGLPFQLVPTFLLAR